MKKINFIIFISSFLFLTNSVFAQAVLFVGDGCPHCERVEEYLTENKIREKFDIKTLEIFNHPENQIVYEQESQRVGYQGGGVPLLIEGNKYESGDVSIINYYDEKLKTYKPGTAPSEAIKEEVKVETKPTKLTEEELNEIKDMAGQEDLTEVVNESNSEQNSFGFSFGNNKYYYSAGTIIVIIIAGLIFIPKKKRRK